MAAEWPRQHSVIVQGRTSHRHLTLLCRMWLLIVWSIGSFRKHLLAAWCARARALQRRLFVQAYHTHTAEFAMASSIRQGGVESPWCFNLVIRTIYHEQRDDMISQGTSVPLLGRVPMLGWADNLFLGDSIAAVQRTLDAFTVGMHNKGMR